MKKYGKKWRTLHPDLASKLHTNDILKMQEQKRVRQTPWDRQMIESLQKKACGLISIYQEKEIDTRSRFEKQDKARICPFEDYFKEIIIIEPPYYFLKPTPVDLKSSLKQIMLSFICEVNTIFEFSSSNIDHYLLINWNYDIETYGIEPLGEFYIDTLCEVLEGSTWHTRKNRDLIFEKIKDAFTESAFIKKYRFSETHKI